MRLWLVAVLVAASALAYVLPTESLDVFYWATPSAVKIVGLDGRELWAQQAVYPLIATDRTGRCLAIANRLYIYDISVNRFVIERSLSTTVELSPQLVETLAQYGIRLPQEIPVVLNFARAFTIRFARETKEIEGARCAPLAGKKERCTPSEKNLDIQWE